MGSCCTAGRTSTRLVWQLHLWRCRPVWTWHVCLFTVEMMATICTFHQESFGCVEPSLLWRTDPYRIIIDGKAIWTKIPGSGTPHDGAETYHFWQGSHWKIAGHLHSQTPAMNRLRLLSLKVKAISECIGFYCTSCSPVVVIITHRCLTPPFT